MGIQGLCIELVCTELQSPSSWAHTSSSVPAKGLKPSDFDLSRSVWELLTVSEELRLRGTLGLGIMSVHASVTQHSYLNNQKGIYMCICIILCEVCGINHCIYKTQ